VHQYIHNRQYAYGIEYDDADKPCQMIIFGGFPHGHSLPYHLPSDQDAKKNKKPSRMGVQKTTSFHKIKFGTNILKTFFYQIAQIF